MVVLMIEGFNTIGVNSFARMDSVPKLRNDEFKGKVVLVTGGSSGIGYETALEFARRGANVVIASRDSHPGWFNGSSAANSISTDPDVVAAGGIARWVQTNVANYESVRTLFQNILRTEGQLDIAVNNAGVCGPMGNINTVGKFIGTEYDPIQNNLVGTIHSLIEETQYFIDSQKNGIIVNIASIAGLTGLPGASLYGASKFGVSSLTRSVALEFLRGTPTIRVNAVAPGLVNTSLAWQMTKYFEDGEQSWEGEYVTPESALWKKWGPQLIAQLRSGRIAEPSEQAAVVLFLASDAASYISGAVFPVDLGAVA